MMWDIVLACGIPSTIVGGFISYRINKFVKRQESRDKAREDINILMIQGVDAAIGLSEAVATAQKNGRCNGETESAMAYAVGIKHKIRDFLTKRSIESIY